MKAPAPPDARIKRLLLSVKPAQQKAGLVLLDETYREEIHGYIRFWNEKSLVKLNSDDLSDIWRATLNSVALNVENGKFKSKGDLRAYLRTIAHCRAVDLIRKILRIRPTAYLDDRPVWSPVQRGEILEAINKLVRNLRDKLRIVIETDIVLFFEEFKWPSIEVLTVELNRLFPQTPLTKSAVRGRRSRGRAKLRELVGPDNLDSWI